MQEFLLAREVALMCGSSILNLGFTQIFLREVTRDFMRSSHGVSHDWSAFVASPAYILMQQRTHHQAYHKGARAPLFTLLVHNRRTDCHDPRD